MKRILIIGLGFLFGVILFAQSPVAVKDSAASQVLNQTAKEHAADQAAFNTKLQQARYSLDQSNKDLQKQIQDLQKTLQDKLKADKHYKDLLDQIDALQKKFNENSQRANEAFQRSLAGLPQKIQTENAQMQSLIDVVRKENNLPADATYNEEKQIWTITPAKNEPPKTAKK